MFNAPNWTKSYCRNRITLKAFMPFLSPHSPYKITQTHSQTHTHTHTYTHTSYTHNVWVRISGWDWGLVETGDWLRWILAIYYWDRSRAVDDHRPLPINNVANNGTDCIHGRQRNGPDRSCTILYFTDGRHDRFLLFAVHTSSDIYHAFQPPYLKAVLVAVDD